MFLRKYQNLIRRKQPSTNRELVSFSKLLKLPLKYEKCWRFNLIYKANKSHIATYDFHGNKKEIEINDEESQEFEFIIHLYLDFCQKEKVCS